MSSEEARRFTDTLRALESPLSCIPLTPLQIRWVQEIYDQSLPAVSASEALYGFCGWLRSFPAPITIGKDHNPAWFEDCIQSFCKANHLPLPREGWDKKLNPKFYKEPRTMDTNCTLHQQPLCSCKQCIDVAVKREKSSLEKENSTLRGALLQISTRECLCIPGTNAAQSGQCPRCLALQVLS